jgi:hypothetical protein
MNYYETSNAILKAVQSSTCTFATVEMKSPAKLRVKQSLELFGIHPKNMTVEKRSKAQYFVGTSVSYKRIVEKRLVKSEVATQIKTKEWVESPLPWGELVNGAVITHKGKEYVRLYAFGNMVPEVDYFIDGRIATESEVVKIKEAIGEKTESKKQTEHGMLDDYKLVVRSPKLESIQSIAINGQVLKAV